MKILIVDRDIAAREALKATLEAQGHFVAVESTRDGAQQQLDQGQYDVMAIDPSPVSMLKQITLPLRWNHRDKYLYLILLGNHFNDEEVLRSGLNDIINKPLHAQDIATKIGNAERLTQFMQYLWQADLPPFGRRVFGSEAFSQLMISALDRAYRYNERAYLLRMQLTNGQELAGRLGKEAMQRIFAEMGQYLSDLHRLSDFFGHTDEAGYSLLLLRPALSSEPQDAAERFAIALRDFQDSVAPEQRPQFSLELLGLPSAAIEATLTIN